LFLPHFDVICDLLGTLRYEDGKARTATAVDAGNFGGSRRVAKNEMLKTQRTATSIIRTSHKLFTEAMISIRL